jgi:hypothetical protein
MGNDLPDDADVPPDEHSDQPADRADMSRDDGGRSDRVGRDQVETRGRDEYYADLRAAIADERTNVPDRARAEDQAEATERAEAGRPAQAAKPTKEAEGWEESAERYRGMWAEYRRRWPPEERSPVDKSDDSPGSWRGDNNQFFDRAINGELEELCNGIGELEREQISPRLRLVESCDPDRRLIGFEHRLKSRDRIKEKVYDDVTLLGHSPEESISALPDAIRYTFQYEESRYAHGVQADIIRMREQGFELIELRNYWSADQYKGINSQWIEPQSGQRFELQFHTEVSFEAKQITHGAYEQLRIKKADKFDAAEEFEAMVLEAFQRTVSSAVPIPRGAVDIPEYPEKERHAR